MENREDGAPTCAERNGAHTAGPWHVARVRDEYAVIEDGNGNVVADVYGENRLERAHLMAASQSLVIDLLAIAEDAMRCAAYWNGPQQSSFNRIEATARADIAKAEGRTDA